MGYRINVKNAKYATISADSSTAYTLGTAVDLPGLMTLDITMTSATGELYGDGAKVSNQSKVTGAQVKLALNKLSTAARAALLGATIESNGALTIKTSDVAPKIALYAETEEDDGRKEQMWFLVGTCEPISLSAQQSAGSITYSTDELTIDFVRREKDLAVYKLLDTSDTAVTESASTAFASSPD